MKQIFKKTLMALGSAVVIGSAFAAPPTPQGTRSASGLAQPYPPGALGTIQVLADVTGLVNEKAFGIQFTITGKCRVDFTPGDGSASVRFEGGAEGGGDQPLIVEKTYTYNTTFSSASQVFKPVTMQFKTVSPCINKAPLSQTMVNAKVQPPIKQDILSSAPGLGVKQQRTGAIDVPTKPAVVAITSPVKTVLATLGEISLSGNMVTGTSTKISSLVAGEPTKLTVQGTGICNYRLSYVNLNSDGGTIQKAYPMIPTTSSIQTPFPMVGMEVLKNTAAGVYRWSAVGINGCTGSVSTTFTVN